MITQDPFRAGGRFVLKVSSIVGVALVVFGLFGLACVAFSPAAALLARPGFTVGTVNPAIGGAMLVSGAILLFAGKKTIS